MTTTTDQPGSGTSEVGGSKRALAGVRSKVIYIWAAIGLSMVLLQLWIFGAWLASGPEEITRFRTPGSTSWWWAQIFQYLFLAIAVIAGAVVGRRCWRERRLTIEAMLMIGTLSIWWQDPLYNYFRPGFYYNSNLINLESWVDFIPGVVAPYGNLGIEPLVWGFGCYFAAMAVQVFFMVWVIRKMRERWPHLSGSALFTIVWLLGFAMDAAIEIPMIHTRIYAYPAAWTNMALWGGTPFQLPWLHFAEGALFFAGCAALLAFRDDRGLTAVERGAPAIRSPGWRNVAQLLAVVGFVNVISLAYCPLVQLQILHSDHFPQGFEPAQTNGWCGDRGEPYGPCPAPGVDIKVKQPGQGHQSPSEIYRRFPFFQTPEGGAKP